MFTLKLDSFEFIDGFHSSVLRHFDDYTEILEIEEFGRYSVAFELSTHLEETKNLDYILDLIPKNIFNDFNSYKIFDKFYSAGIDLTGIDLKSIVQISTPKNLMNPEMQRLLSSFTVLKSSQKYVGNSKFLLSLRKIDLSKTGEMDFQSYFRNSVKRNQQFSSAFNEILYSKGFVSKTAEANCYYRYLNLTD